MVCMPQHALTLPNDGSGTPGRAKKPKRSRGSGSDLVNRIKYTALVNLARICESTDKVPDAIEYSLKAAALDGSDVSLWMAIGNRATTTTDFKLARFAFEQAHVCSPYNWLTVMRLAETLFVLDDYATLECTAKL